MSKKKEPSDLQECGNCKFFKKNEHDELGFCRRYPPVVLPVDDGITVELPIVESSDWCGEWQRKLDS